MRGNVAMAEATQMVVNRRSLNRRLTQSGQLERQMRGMGNDGPLDRRLALPAGSFFDDESSGNDKQHRSQAHDPEAPSGPDFLQQQIETERNHASANSPGGQDYAICQTPFPDKILCWNDRTGLRVFSSIPEST